MAETFKEKLYELLYKKTCSYADIMMSIKTDDYCVFEENGEVWTDIETADYVIETKLQSLRQVGVDIATQTLRGGVMRYRVLDSQPTYRQFLLEKYL